MYWAWLGMIYLIIMTIKDYTNKMKIDDRLNSFMMGVTISLYSHFNYAIWYIVAVIALVFLMRWVLKKIKPLGEADINSIAWIFLGFSILNLYSVVWFFGIFIMTTIIYAFLKHSIFKMNVPTPFYSVILICFFLVNLLYGFFT